MDPDTLAATQVEQTIGLLRTAAGAIRSVTGSPIEEAKAVHAAAHALLAREADLLAQIDESKAHEGQGCASVATWASREFGQDVSTTRQMVAAARTMTELPDIGADAHAGQVSLDHVHAMTYALKHCDAVQVRDNETDFRILCRQVRPKELFAELRVLRAAVNPQELDEAYLRGMDRSDIQCLKLLDGFHVTGHLPTDVGAKFKIFLDSVSVPRDGEDTRTPAQRRIDGFDQYLTTALGDGLPATGGVKPHLSIIVDADTLKRHLNRTAEPAEQPTLDDLLDRKPATLEGFGPIGPALLTWILYGGNLTAILVAGFKENRKVLDAHQMKRVATEKQRRIIAYRQKSVCANRGCHHPIGEIHHVIDWAYGGETNLDNLVGLCRKCHTLITTGRLQMTGTYETGYTFTTSRAGPTARTG